MGRSFRDSIRSWSIWLSLLEASRNLSGSRSLTTASNSLGTSVSSIIVCQVYREILVWESLRRRLLVLCVLGVSTLFLDIWSDIPTDKAPTWSSESDRSQPARATFESFRGPLRIAPLYQAHPVVPVYKGKYLPASGRGVSEARSVSRGGPEDSGNRSVRVPEPPSKHNAQHRVGKRRLLNRSCKLRTRIASPRYHARPCARAQGRDRG